MISIFLNNFIVPLLNNFIVPLLNNFIVPLLYTSFGFTIGYALNEIYIKPMIKQRELKGKIIFNLIYYKHLYSNLVNKEDELRSLDNFNERKKARNIFLGLASEISSFEFIFLNKAMLFSDKELRELKGNLFGLTNGMFSDNIERNVKYVKEIEKVLLKNEIKK